MLSSCFAQQNHIPLTPGSPPMLNDMAEKGIHYYKVTIPDNYDSQSDLVIEIKGKDMNSDPDLHISSTNYTPTNMQDSEYSCAVVGEDICTVPSSALKAKKQFYVAAKCYRKCHYEISVDLKTEFEIGGRKDYKVPMKAGDTKIFSFYNPHPGVKDLVFTARASSRTASIRMYLTAGKNNVPTTSGIRSNDGWEDGIVIRLTEKTSPSVKEQETYKLLVESDDDTTVSVRVDLLYSDKLIEEGESYEDFVNYNDKTCYKYVVRSTDKKLRIGAYSFSGNPDIYVNPESVPSTLEGFAFKATEPSDDVLVLTPEDRLKAGYKKGMYYICIVGHSNTSYRLRVAESDQEFYLEDGIAETNEVAVGKETSFYYTDPALSRDLNLTFTLSIKSGPKPNMYVKFCGRTPEEQCVIGNKDDPDVFKATSQTGTLFSFIKHQGSSCSSLVPNQDKTCSYLIEVSSPSSDFTNDVTHFALVAQHNETSHIRLREGMSVEQIVENHQVRYFEFVVRDSLASNVTFVVESHHGDADLYVSRTQKYPGSKNYDKKSARSRRFADEVTFNRDENESLIGVYYIAVQGFEYSSYSIRATITRGSDPEKIVPVQLSEGIQINDIITETYFKKYYQFKTAMYGNSITDIKISLTQISGEFTFYAKSGSFPTEGDYDYKSEDGSDIIMKTTDSKFQAVGMKYVMVIPHIRYGQESSTYRYSLTYTTTRSISVVKKETPSFGTVEVGKINYYKYISVDKGADATISLTALTGDANLLVSIDPRLPYPTLDTNDFHSKKVGTDSIKIKGDKLFDKNPSCIPSEQALLGSKPCEIYIGVYCSDSAGVPENREGSSCSYSLKVYAEDYGFPHMLIDGMPQKDSTMQAKNVNYFMPVEPQRDYLYIAATAETGDVNIFISFADQSHKNEELVLPNSRSYIKKGKGIAHSQVIHFTKKELQKHCGEHTECMALITVEGKSAIEKNEYTLVAYTHIPRLIENTPVVGKVEKDAPIYYSYKSLCEDCTIIVSASSYSIDADIDLYINVGHKKELPTKDAHDIKSEQWFSEHIMIDRDNEQVKKKGIKSLKDTLIIAVYGKDAATISIEVEETASKVQKLKQGKSIKIEQEPNKIRYFKYDHKQFGNIKFELTGLSGSVEMRVNHYTDFSNDQPMHKFLPQDEYTSLWRTHSRQNATIKIDAEEDDDYCVNCMYLIGIESHSSGAKYLLEVQQEEVFSNKHIKLGVPVKDQIAENDFKQYVFVLDKKKDFRVSVSVYLGKVEYSVATDEEFEDIVAKAKNESLVIDEYALDDFEEGENVYIRVHGLYAHSEYILIASHHDSYSILPDSYTQEITINPFERKDINLLYYPPSIEFELKILLNSLSDGMQYQVYTQKQYINKIQGDDITFPDKHSNDKNVFFWDNVRHFGYKHINQNPDRDDEYLILVTVVPTVINSEALSDKQKVKFTINANAHEINILSPNNPFEEYLQPQPDNYKYFRFFANGNRQLELILTPCVCDVDAFLFKSMDQAKNHNGVIDRTRHMVNGEKKIVLKNATGPYYVKVQLTSEKQDTEYLKNSDYCAFEIIVNDKEHENYAYSVDQYVAEDNGRVQYWWPSVRRLKFKWGRVLKEDRLGTTQHPAIYSLWLIKRPTLFVNSVCGVLHAQARGEAELIQGGISENEIQINPRHNKYTNSHPYATYTIMANVNRLGAAVPYQPVRMYVRIAWYHLIGWFDILIMIAVIGGLGYGIYYYRRKAKVTQEKLDFEMNDIRNVARVGYSDDSVEATGLKRTPE